MHRSKGNPRIIRDDRFRAVAMMRVEIPDRHSLRPLSQSVQRGHHDVIEVTKTHCLVAGRMMSGRTHQAEGELATQRRCATAQAAPEARAAYSKIPA